MEVASGGYLPSPVAVRNSANNITYKNLPNIFRARATGLNTSRDAAKTGKYLVNKPLQATGILEDNARG